MNMRLTLPAAAKASGGFSMTVTAHETDFSEVTVQDGARTLLTLQPGERGSFEVRRRFFRKRWCVIDHETAEEVDSE